MKTVPGVIGIISLCHGTSAWPGICRSGQQFPQIWTAVYLFISPSLLSGIIYPVSDKSEKIKTAVEKPASSMKFLLVLSFCTSPIGTGIISKIYSVAGSLTIIEE